MVRLCPSCHHNPSCRLRPEYAGAECNCECHDAADHSPALVEQLKVVRAALAHHRHWKESMPEALIEGIDCVLRAAGQPQGERVT
jgi:hypothetical protein